MAFAVDHRFAEALVAGMQEDGLVVAPTNAGLRWADDVGTFLSGAEEPNEA
jgi:hypothetical protein